MPSQYKIGNGGIKWTSVTEYYDIDGGIQITQKDAKDKNKYIQIRITKTTEINNSKTWGKIKYTIECQKNPQGKLW